MIRVINFVFIAVTGLACLGLYRVAEATRVAGAELATTERALVREKSAMTILGAEWARLTQPARIAALAAKHLDLAAAPPVELSSLTELPRREDAPLNTDGALRDAKAVVPQTEMPQEAEPEAPAAHAVATSGAGA